MSQPAHRLVVLLSNLAINILLLLVVDSVFDGVRLHGWRDFVVASILLMLVNAFLKPVLIILTLPINILTLGLFTLVINAILLQSIAWLLPGFDIDGFWTAIGAALVMGIVNFLLNWFLNPRNVQVRVYHR